MLKIWKKIMNIAALTGMREVLMLAADLFIFIASATVLLFTVSPALENWKVSVLHFLLLFACICFFMVIFRTYRSLWEYAAGHEYLRLIEAALAGYVSYVAVAFLLFRTVPPILITLVAALLSTILMLALRIAYRQYREYVQFHENSLKRTPVLIIGAGDAGALLANELLRNANGTRLPVCFVDDDPNKIGRQIHNVQIEGPISRLPEIAARHDVREIILAMPSVARERQREILKTYSKLGCHVKVLPDVLTTVQSHASGRLLQTIRDVQIEDLLGREPIAFENNDAYAFLSGKVVMVTGGGGSIGSELCRQIAKRQPKRLIVVDIYENNAYDVQQELVYHYRDALDLRVEIASVRDEHKINRLFEKYRPEIVFHAAAHKHVPLMEYCPEEAILNNVFGTYHVACAADRYGAERFILISTDKAVNPTNVMGASKRLCEMVVQGMNSISSTRFAAVRFGNVLGSNGSVIPLFRRQIEQGGPVTITDKRIIRYFMTIPEAAQLVLQAGAMATQQSEIFVLDMGSPVSILELAENLIRLSGRTPYIEIPIIETGLRPGEKLYEELLMRNEDLTSTPNQKIFIERQTTVVSRADLETKLQRLQEVLTTDSPEQVIAVMKELVPTYKSPEEVNSQKTADLNYAAAIAGQAQ